MGRALIRVVVRMTSRAEEKVFLSVPVAAILRLAEIILKFPSGDLSGRAGNGRTALSGRGVVARSRVSVVMSRLRNHLERRRANEKKLQALLHRLTEPD